MKLSELLDECAVIRKILTDPTLLASEVTSIDVETNDAIVIKLGKDLIFPRKPIAPVPTPLPTPTPTPLPPKPRS